MPNCSGSCSSWTVTFKLLRLDLFLSKYPAIQEANFTKQMIECLYSIVLSYAAAATTTTATTTTTTMGLITTTTGAATKRSLYVLSDEDPNSHLSKKTYSHQAIHPLTAIVTSAISSLMTPSKITEVL